MMVKKLQQALSFKHFVRRQKNEADFSLSCGLRFNLILFIAIAILWSSLSLMSFHLFSSWLLDNSALHLLILPLLYVAFTLFLIKRATIKHCFNFGHEGFSLTTKSCFGQKTLSIPWQELSTLRHFPATVRSASMIELYHKDDSLFWFDSQLSEDAHKELLNAFQFKGLELSEAETLK